MNEPQKSNGDGLGTADEAALARFAQSFRRDLPRMSDEAMRRVESTVRAELDRSYPPSPLPAPAWLRWAAVAAMFVLTVGLAWHVSNGPRVDRTAPVVGQVSDEFEMVIEIDPRGLPGPTAATPSGASDSLARWDALLRTAEQYASLIGMERLTRR